MNKIFQKGKICVLDVNNAFKQPTYGTIQVELIDKIKSRPFGNSVWSVKDAINPHAPIINVSEKFLSPDGMSVVRNPINLPIFNSLDVEVLNKIIDNSSTTNMSESDINRVKALKEKICLSISLTEV